MDNANPQNPRSDATGTSAPPQGRAPHNGEHAGPPDAQGRMEEEGQEETLPKDLPKVPTLRIIIIVAVLLVFLIGLFLAGYIPHHRQVAKLAQKSKQVQDAKPTVEFARPRKTDAAMKLQLPGNAIPLQQTSIFPRATGYLKTLYVDIGDHVTEGQLLAEIDAPDVDAQLASAKASVQQAEANLTRAHKDHDLSMVTLERYKGFFTSGGVTKQQLDERQNAFNEADSNLEAAKAAVASAKAEVQRLTALTGFEKIYAPFDGVVAVRNFDVGALFNPTNTSIAQQLFEIDRTDTLRVFVNVPQVYATDIKIGQPAKFNVPNYPGQPADGMIARSAGALDMRTRTLRMQVNFPNPQGRLLSGMYGQVEIQVPRQMPQLLIPTSALIFNAERLRVAVVDSQQKIHFKKIAVGRDFGTEVEVTGGLNDQDLVVVNPGERLGEGVDVKASPAKETAKDSQSGGRNGQDAPGDDDQNPKQNPNGAKRGGSP